MEEDDLISKTRRKRQMRDLQDVGAALVDLSEGELARIGLPETLLDAVLACKAITKHEARRRQVQYIGRLMRHVDSAPIAERLRALEAPSQRDTALHHLAEKWRQDLLADPGAMARFQREFPEADAGHLGNLVKGALDEKRASRPPRCFRELFHAVHALIQEQARRSA
ncbi:MAG TPA: ribosome biogenesis factor YjgA [Usitatibacter sp.]